MAASTLSVPAPGRTEPIDARSTITQAARPGATLLFPPSAKGPIIIVHPPMPDNLRPILVKTPSADSPTLKVNLPPSRIFPGPKVSTKKSPAAKIIESFGKIFGGASKSPASSGNNDYFGPDAAHQASAEVVGATPGLRRPKAVQLGLRVAPINLASISYVVPDPDNHGEYLVISARKGAKVQFPSVKNRSLQFPCKTSYVDQWQMRMWNCHRPGCKHKFYTRRALHKHAHYYPEQPKINKLKKLRGDLMRCYACKQHYETRHELCLHRCPMADQTLGRKRYLC